MVAASAIVGTLLFGRVRGNEPLDVEWGNRRIDRRVQYEPRDRIGSHRREQDAVAVMAGCKDEAIERPRTKDRRIIATARPMANPHLVDRQLLDRRYRAP